MRASFRHAEPCQCIRWLWEAHLTLEFRCVNGAGSEGEAVLRARHRHHRPAAPPSLSIGRSARRRSWRVKISAPCVFPHFHFIVSSALEADMCRPGQCYRPRSSLRAFRRTRGRLLATQMRQTPSATTSSTRGADCCLPGDPRVTEVRMSSRFAPLNAAGSSGTRRLRSRFSTAMTPETSASRSCESRTRRGWCVPFAGRSALR